MISVADDPVKGQVAAHWNRRAAHFDEDFGHSIRTPAERAAWDRVLALCVPAGPLDALDVGCGTGFLSLELAARGHRVTGVDFAQQMLARARQKAAATSAAIRFEEADAENLPFADQSFDIALSRHLLWTLPHPQRAIEEWLRVLRPGGRLVLFEGEADAAVEARSEPLDNARASPEYAAIGGRLPFLAGRPRDEIVALFAEHGLVDVGSDPFLDLVAEQERRMAEEGRPRRTRRRYAVWGDKPR